MMSELQDVEVRNQDSNKENISQKLDETYKDLNGSGDGKRAPLQPVNYDGGGICHTIYSPVTPVSGARSRTPFSGKRTRPRPPLHSRRTLSVCGKHSPLNLFNTLVFNKTKKVIDQALQEERQRLETVEEWLRQRDEEIVDLKAEISRLSALKDVEACHLIAKEPTAEERLSRVDNSADVQEWMSRLAARDDECRIFCTEITLLKQQLAACESELMQRTSVTAEEIERRIQNAKEETMKQQQQEIADLNKQIIKLHEELSHINQLKKQEADLCNEYRIQNDTNFQLRRELEAQLSKYSKSKSSVEEEKKPARIKKQGTSSCIPVLLRRPNSHLNVSKQPFKSTSCGDQAKVAGDIRNIQKTLAEDRKKFDIEREEFIKQKVDWLEWKDEKEESIAATEEAYEQVLKANAEREAQEKTLKDSLSAAEQKIMDLSSNVNALELCLKDENNIKNNLTERLNAAEQLVVDTKEKSVAEIERRETEIVNLQRTIDMREHDIDELTKERNNFQKLVTGMKAQITKYQSIISKVVDLELQIKLLENEKKAVCEEMLDVKRKLNESTKNLQQLTANYKALECELTSQINKVETLQSSLKETNDALLLKNSELAKTMECTDLLYRKATLFFEKLVSQWDSWNRVSENGAQIKTTPCQRKGSSRISSAQKRRSSRGASSFVYQIISASKRSTRSVAGPGMSEVGRETTATEPSGGDVSCHLEDRCHQSLDVQVTPESRQKNPENPSCSVDPNLHSSSVDAHLPAAVSGVNELFSKMEQILKEEVAVKFAQMHCQIKHLEHCLSTEEKNRLKQLIESQHVIERLSSDVRQKEQKARRAAERSAELEMDLSRNAEQLQELKSMFNDQMDYLTERSQQKIEIQKLSLELEVVLNKCKLKDEEVESLKAILNDRLLNADSASSANTAKIIKNLTSEISQLKIQKQNIMYEKFDEKKAWEMSSYKLKEQNRILMQQLKVAEGAMAQLDDKIERIRKALLPHVSFLRGDEELNQILKEIKAFD